MYYKMIHKIDYNTIKYKWNHINRFKSVKVKNYWVNV